MFEEKEMWFVKRVSHIEYAQIVPDREVFFNEPIFTELNKDKVDEVFYLIIMRANSARFGIIAGRKGDVLLSPFSAPYSYPVSLIKESKQETIDCALEVFEDYCREIGIRSIYFILPPLFYNEHLLSGWISALYRQKYLVKNLDINYSLSLKKLNVNEEKYVKLITHKGRDGFKRAEKSNLRIIRCTTEEEYRLAYEIICIGHESKGFPVKMSFDQLFSTLKIVNHDVFIVMKGNVGIVAEVLYVINDRIIQGIYTGTLPQYIDCNGMNFLTYYTIRYYGDRGFLTIDKAISTEDSIPNYGLCNFKESVGCERSLKYSFMKTISI